MLQSRRPRRRWPSISLVVAMLMVLSLSDLGIPCTATADQMCEVAATEERHGGGGTEESYGESNGGRAFRGQGGDTDHGTEEPTRTGTADATDADGGGMAMELETTSSAVNTDGVEAAALNPSTAAATSATAAAASTTPVTAAPSATTATAMDDRESGVKSASTVDDTTSAAVPLVLSWTPRVFSVPGFLTPGMCDEIINATSPLLAPSTTIGKHREKKLDEKRTSDTAWLPRRSERTEPVIKALIEKIHALIMVPPGQGETLQIVHYGEGAKYEFHHDTDMRLARYATVLVYLNTPDAGGETIFPLLRLKGSRKGSSRLPLPMDIRNLSSGVAAMEPYCASDEFLKVKAKKGDALVFFSVSTNKVLDERVWHGACPVMKGEKYVAQRWVKLYPDPNYQRELRKDGVA